MSCLLYTSDAADDLLIFRRLAKWLYRALEAEYEYQTSDKITDECLAANEYTFTAEGRRFG